MFSKVLSIKVRWVKSTWKLYPSWFCQIYVQWNESVAKCISSVSLRFSGLAPLLPTVHVVQGKVMFWHVSVHKSVCPHLGGYPGQVQTGATPPWVPPIRPGGGVLLSKGKPTSGIPHQTWLGVPLLEGGTLAGGYPTLGTPCQTWPGEYPYQGGTPPQDPPGRTWPEGTPARGTPPLVPLSDLAGVPHLGYPCQTWLGGAPAGGYPTLGTPPPSDLAGGYPCQGGGGTPPRVEYLIRHGRYASCVYAGELSCCNIVFRRRQKGILQNKTLGPQSMNLISIFSHTVTRIAKTILLQKPYFFCIKCTH